MSSRRTLLLIWLLVSALWERQVLSAWNQTATPNQSAKAAIDECDSVFPPRADGYATQYSNSWGSWEYAEEHRHPNCAPLVGSTGFLSFVAMQAPARAALRQQAEDAIAGATRTSIETGIALPAALLAIGLLLNWISRRIRPA